MKLDISEHAKERAKQRFRLKPKSLQRLAVKVLQHGKLIASNRYKIKQYVYGHFRLVFNFTKEKIVLITIVNQDSKSKYVSESLDDTYLKGKKMGKIDRMMS